MPGQERGGPLPERLWAAGRPGAVSAGVPHRRHSARISRCLLRQQRRVSYSAAAVRTEGGVPSALRRIRSDRIRRTGLRSGQRTCRDRQIEPDPEHGQEGVTGQKPVPFRQVRQAPEPHSVLCGDSRVSGACSAAGVRGRNGRANCAAR